MSKSTSYVNQYGDFMLDTYWFSVLNVLFHAYPALCVNIFHVWQGHSDLITSDPFARSQVTIIVQKRVHIENPPERPKKEYISEKKNTDGHPIRTAQRTLWYSLIVDTGSNVA